MNLSLPMKQGMVVCEDYQYTREGSCSIFMFCEPFGGRCHVDVSKHRTKVDWAHRVWELLEVHYPTAKKIRLVWIISIRIRWVLCMRIFAGGCFGVG